MRTYRSVHIAMTNHYTETNTRKLRSVSGGQCNESSTVTSAISPLQNVLCRLKYDNTLISSDYK